MHEVSIAFSVLEGVSEQALACNARKVTSVHLRIGAASGVQIDALRFAWDLVAEGTVAQSSRLRIEEVAIGIACRSCGYRGTPEPPLRCPHCAAEGCDIAHGREMDVVAMEIEDEPETDRRRAIDPEEKHHARA